MGSFLLCAVTAGYKFCSRAMEREWRPYSRRCVAKFSPKERRAASENAFHGTGREAAAGDAHSRHQLPLFAPAFYSSLPIRRSTE
jgi:hypothetical protein